MTNLLVKCTRCRHIHNGRDRVEIKGSDGWWHSSCPKCKGRITTEFTWDDFHFSVIKLKPLMNIHMDLIEKAFKFQVTPKQFVAAQEALEFLNTKSNYTHEN